MANLPQVSNISEHRFNIATSYGTYAGHHSFTLGLSGLNDRGTIIYNVSGTLTYKGHVSFGVELGYQFDENNRVNDTERNKIAELENIIKVLQEKVEKLERK